MRPSRSSHARPPHVQLDHGRCHRLDRRLRACVGVVCFACFLQPGLAPAGDCIDFGGSPTWQSILETPGQSFGVAAAGEVAYVADGLAGVQVVDISDPLAPVILTSIDTPGIAQDLALAGDVLVVADGVSGTAFIDVSDPGSPAWLGSVEAEEAIAVTVSGTHAFVADQFTGLLVIDFSTPTAPRLASVAPTVIATGVHVDGDVAYIADRYFGVKVFDVANLDAPMLIGEIDTPSLARDLDVVGDFAFVADFGSGLQVLDVSDPSEPMIVASLDTEAAASIEVRDGVAYVADRNEGLVVLDVTDPVAPFRIGSVPAGDLSWDLYVSDGDVFLVSREAGLHSAPVHCPDVASTPADPVAVRSMLSVSPNPVRTSATIRLDLGVATIAQGAIHDPSGRRIRSLPFRASEPALLAWDGRDERGRMVPSGVYLVRVDIERRGLDDAGAWHSLTDRIVVLR